MQRRTQLTQRRRRVLYTHQCAGSQVQENGRRAKALREARRPTMAYGARVYRRLRARWFGIVPVRRRTMMLVVAILAGGAILLTVAHGASLGWPPLAYRASIARPFRLDRPDSFGNWLGTLLFASSAVIALMIYQLRRHRTSDYQGHYRLWRPTIILLALASIDTSMQLTDWLGHIVDEAIGERRAIAGGNWVRLLLVVGGVTWSMRLVAEVRRSKLAAITLAAAAGMLMMPTLARWNIVKLESLAGATLLAAAPLLGSALLWIGLVAYLRMLYRDVRNLDAGDRLADHIQQWRQRWREATARRPRREPTGKTKAKSGISSDQPTPPRLAKETAATNQEESETDTAERKARPAAGPRGWFQRKGKKPKATAAAAAADEAQEKPPRPKRRWLPRISLRRRPRPSTEDSSDQEKEEADASRSQRQNAASTSTSSHGRGSGGQTSSDRSGSSPPAANAASADHSHSEESEEPIDPASIDWNGLSKSERRRLKRQLRRQERAA